jgi:alanyl-tRNA synthetase
MNRVLAKENQGGTAKRVFAPEPGGGFFICTNIVTEVNPMKNPKPYGVNELREMFLKFFETKGHLRLPSFSLIPQNDASLLLINSGMAPMKPYFTGEQEPPRHRVCTCQKCIRTGDIENIGKTARHGTYFEMLGNFSFGDYFKEDAIHWAWEFLTSDEWVGLDPDRLYPSVFAGNETTPADDEAFRIWNEEIGIPADRIFKFGKEDNFWEHGSGPCGPCSEIYYDRGPEYGCGKPGCTVGCDCDRYMEVWNVVFSQFDNDGENHYTELKQKNIDTGMGLERLACVCQNVPSLFDTDTVMNITNKVSEITHAHYGESYKTDVSLRIITDHIRSAAFMICDGVLPSNEGRGYVLRRLLRRAARHGKLLGVNDPFLYSVCDTVIHENEGHYPELRERQDYITRVIRVEEENFAKTIDGGLRIFNEMLLGHKEKGETTFSGADAFKLYDTYGFPIDLTLEMVEEQGMQLDEAEFHRQMEEQRQRARKAREALGDLGWAGVEFGKDVPETEFVGYEQTECSDAKIVALVVENELAEELMPGVEGIVVLDKTPCYAEMGGQVGDHGFILADGARFVVTDVQKNKGGKYMHYGKLTEGLLKLGDTVSVSIDGERRKAIQRAHSATHLLQAALRQVLGSHVQQAGSLVEPDRLRFDFTHFSAITPEELLQIESLVCEWALEGMPIDTRVMPIGEAKQLGATALFGEKYGDTVRVVSMGDCSMEFCGGTHLDNTSKVGLFRILSESSIASGVRRIEAITGKEILREDELNKRRMLQVAETLKTTPADLVHKAESQIKELRELRQAVEKLESRLMAGDVERFLFAAKKVAGLQIITATLQGQSADALRKMGDMLRDRDENSVAVLATFSGEKITFHASCGKRAVARGIKAGDLIKQVTKITGGSGGGKPESAMGGGKDILKIDDALATIDDYVAEHAKEEA